MNYTNPPLDTPQLISSLRERSLTIVNEDAISFLEDVSYFRFAAYLRPLENENDDKHFKENATMEQAIALYEFDAEFRMLLQQIEKYRPARKSSTSSRWRMAHSGT